MCYASEEIISILNKIKYPYNVNIRTQELALDALENAYKKDIWVDEILKERDALARELEKLQRSIGGIKTLDALPDALFIIDPWLWIVLGLSVWLARRRPSAGAVPHGRPHVLGQRCRAGSPSPAV